MSLFDVCNTLQTPSSYYIGHLICKFCDTFWGWEYFERDRLEEQMGNEPGATCRATKNGCRDQRDRLMCGVLQVTQLLWVFQLRLHDKFTHICNDSIYFIPIESYEYTLTVATASTIVVTTVVATTTTAAMIFSNSALINSANIRTKTLSSSLDTCGLGFYLNMIIMQSLCLYDPCSFYTC